MDKTKRIVKVIIFLVILLAVAGISSVTGLFENIGEAFSMIHIDPVSVVKVVLMVCMVLVLSNLLQLILSFINPEKKRAGTIVTVLSSLIRYAAAIIIVCWGLTILGVSVATIFASVGVLALIVGFGAESLIADVVTGIFMIFENQYNVGDIVEINGFRGTVKSIGIRTTAIADTGENVKIINNSDMKNILNRSTDVSKSVCDIGICYEADLEAIEKLIPNILQEIYNKHTDVFMEVPKYLGVQALADSAVVLRFVGSVREKDIYSAARLLNHDILLAWNKNNITVPYNQLDVHGK